MSTTSEKPQPPDPPDIDDGGGTTSGGSTPSQTDANDKKVPAKKKKVSFKFGLETSDDVRKEPLASFTPPVPIIKKECLTRAIHVKPIIQPSRLDKASILDKPSRLHNIDKLNSLTFKSQVKITTPSSASSDEDDAATTSSLVDDEDNDEAFDDGDKSAINDIANNNASVASTSTTTTTTTITTAKQFVLPKRSVRSSRVIKPNKRFMDETQAATKKNGITTSRKKSNKTESNEGRMASPQHTSRPIVDDMETDARDDEEDGNSNNGGMLGGISMEMSDHIKNNPFAKMVDSSSFGISSKSILRQSRLQFATPSIGLMSSTSTSMAAGAAAVAAAAAAVAPSKDNLFACSLTNVSPINRNAIQLSNAVCGVCTTVSPAAFSHQSRKYGINSCDPCRKFVSKTVKKLAVSGESSLLGGLQCKKGDGSCPIVPSSRSSRSYKAALKERCPACWMKKCIQSYRLRHDIRTKLVALLPQNMRQLDCTSKTFTSSFQIKIEAPECVTNSANSSNSKTNIFTSPLNSSRRMLPAWTKETNSETSEFRSFNTLTNPLAENNVKFGSSLQIVPTITEKPTIMVTTPLPSPSTSVETSTKEAKVIETKDMKRAVIANAANPSIASPKKASTSTSTTTVTAIAAPVEVEEPSRLRLRKKERDAPTTTTAMATTTTTTATVATPLPATSSVPAVGADMAKRQRIDVKGPRVKHVCRSASIVLGQPIATFPDGSPMLDSLDTPPRPESPSGIVEFEPSTLLPVPSDNKSADANKPYGDCADSTRLSPPATPIINEYDSESMKESDKSPEKSDDSSNSMSASSSSSISSMSSSATTTTASTSSTVGAEGVKSKDDTKPITRKVTRPNSMAAGAAHNLNNKKLNSFIRKPEKPVVKAPPLISIDFWENYDPAEVCQTGFGLILSEHVPLNRLCFLCGSFGQEPLMFCVCCCEPYHAFCVEDNYNVKHGGALEDANASFTETIQNGNAGTSIAATAMLPSTHKLNWLCPRCTVCNTCNMSSGSKVKCQKCQKYYHSMCLGTSKRLLGADRALICASCLKCKSCGKSNVSKFVGNLPMCSKCFGQRQKGKYCPLCQKCYADNDYNIKMMECGDCEFWVHAKCEGLTDEQYNMLSVLPEDIEFVCKKCAKSNPTAEKWREAVASEFKGGLMSVVKLLSKTRQACALLKLSPRKKPAAMCRVCVQNAMRVSSASDPYDEEKFDEFTTVTTAPATDDKCYCSASMLTPKTSAADTSQTLLDIKQRIMANKYFSLADFNYDMNIVINAAACDELQTTYKEILSEKFPWFQNETKACTDALEEDMYDSCSFGQASPNEADGVDQQVPMIDVPDDIDQYLYEPSELVADNRVCLFCKGVSDGMSTHQSRLLCCGPNSWVHINCAMWSAEVFEEIDGSLQNVHSAIARGRLIKCSVCGNKGATVGCNVRNCGKHYHFPCARSANCAFMTDKTVYCPLHLDKVNVADGKNSKETNFEVQRPVYVELDRKRRRPISPKNVQFLIGSLHVKQLGRFVATLSDRSDAIVPADFLCTRLYWSSKEPWRIVEYTIKTSVQSNVNAAMDTGRNFTVDHSNNSNKVQIGMAQIAKWHSSLVNGDDFEALLRQERSIKLLNNLTLHHSEEINNDDEPQNNADFLSSEMFPPEIEKTILEDLPPDILEGISLLDIIPNLEDMGEIDMKTEAYLSGMDLLRDNTNDDDLSLTGQRGYDTDNSWPTTNMHVEDAMLSARSVADILNLKRNKSDVLVRNHGGRTHQRPWSNKLDSVISAKRRKLPRFDLRLQESVLLSFGRRKDESALNYSDLSRPTDEMKNKTFTWSAAKCYETNVADTPAAADSNAVTAAAKSRYRISQLDGMDDISVGGDIDFAKMKSSADHTSKAADIQNAQATQQSNMIFTALNGQDYCNFPLLQSNAANPTTSMFITSMQNSAVQMQGMFINQSTQNQAAAAAAQQPIYVQQQLAAAATASQSIPQNGTMQYVQGPDGTVYAVPTTNNNNNINDFNKPRNQQQFTKNTMILPQLDKHQPKKQAIAKLPASPNRGIAKGRAAVNIGGANGTVMAGNKLSEVKLVDDHVLHHSNITQTRFTSLNDSYITTQTMDSVTPTTKLLKIAAKETTMPAKSAGLKMANGTAAGNLVIQSAQSASAAQAPAQQTPIILHQLPQQQQNPQNNFMQIVMADGQIFAVPTANQQPQPQQYLTTNPLMPGTFQLQSSDNNNLLLANTATGLQVLPNGTLQLAPQQQPQVYGTLIQPQATPMMAAATGMMSSDQMMLGAAPFDMVANQMPGYTLLNTLNPQPLYCNNYFNLETIVQNTVMQSQQFVSTAMPGVLSQNSSFSATTTQVFQASKIEPLVDMQSNYLVLNNDGTIMQPTAQQSIYQPNTNMVQYALPQIQAAPIQTTNSAATNASTVSAANLNDCRDPRTVQSIVTTPQPSVSTSLSSSTGQSTVVMSQSTPKIVHSKPQPSAPSSSTGRLAVKPTIKRKTDPPLMKAGPKAAPMDTSQSAITSPAIPNVSANKIDVSRPSPTVTTSSANDMKITARMVTSTSAANPPKRSNVAKPLTPSTAPIVKVVSATIKPKVMRNFTDNNNGSMQNHRKVEANATIATTSSVTNFKLKNTDHKTSVAAHNYPANKSIQMLQSTNTKLDATKPIILPMYQAPPVTASAVTTTTAMSLPLPSDQNTSTVSNGMTKTPICAIDKNALVADERESQARKLLSGKTSTPTNASPALVHNNNIISATTVPSSSQANRRNSVAGDTTITTTAPTNGSTQKATEANKSAVNDKPTQLQTQYPNVLSSSQAHVIQLPNAPYAQPYANGIPTNVVNPIPHYNTTRPTNRVLPMQTIMPKHSPPFVVSETKPLVNMEEKSVRPNGMKKCKSTPVPTPAPSPPSTTQTTTTDAIKSGSKLDEQRMDIALSTEDGVSSVDDDIKMEIDLDLKMEASDSNSSDSNLCGTTSTTTSPSGSDVMRACTAEEAFDKLKNEDTVAMLHSNAFYNNSNVFSSVTESTITADTNTDDKKLLDEQQQQQQQQQQQREDDRDRLTEASVDDEHMLNHDQSRYPSSLSDPFLVQAMENVEMVIANENVNANAPHFSDDDASTKENMNPTPTMYSVACATKLLKIAAKETITKSTGPKLLYEIQSQDGFTYKSTSITDVWEKVFEAVQIARKAHGLSALPVGPLADMCGHQMLGLKTNALKYLLEQLPGVERCTNYKPVYHKRAESTISQSSSSGYWSDVEELKESVHGTARCERYKGRSEYDMFSWLASRHRKQPIQICVPQCIESEAIPRRGSGSNLPMAMRYRTLKETYKDSVGVYRSHIHGRGLFCNRDIEAGEMVIEYAGELIRSTLTDKRERYYDGRGIGCYMFKIDDNLVVDATMRGNAARFINHSCEPNCYSKVVDILGHKHIIIFALRRIVQGEELTYDYKFPFEDTKIPCTCGSRKCRKYLN